MATARAEASPKLGACEVLLDDLAKKLRAPEAVNIGNIRSTLKIVDDLLEEYQKESQRGPVETEHIPQLPYPCPYPLPYYPWQPWETTWAGHTGTAGLDPVHAGLVTSDDLAFGRY